MGICLKIFLTPQFLEKFKNQADPEDVRGDFER